MRLRVDAAEAYFIRCANIQSIDVFDDLERELGRPVVISNQASLCLALRQVGIEDVDPKPGRLLRVDLSE